MSDTTSNNYIFFLNSMQFNSTVFESTASLNLGFDARKKLERNVR